MIKLSELLSLIIDKLNISVKTETQSFSEDEKAQVRANIGIAPADMAQNDESATDYIKNRTHYDNIIQPQLSDLTYNWETADTYTDGMAAHTDLGTFELSIRPELYTLEELFGSDYADIKFGDVVLTRSGPGLRFKVTITQVGPSQYKIIAFSSLSGGFQGATPRITNLKRIVRLDEKYIPDSIARTSDIPDVKYTLPVAGDELGGVRNGGNVVINQDGTMTAPECTAEIPEPDATLTMEGVAADAKAVGDALANVGQPTDAQISAAVSGWLDEHPEATTSVENGSITNEKLAPEVENRLVCLEDEVFTEEVKTQTGEGVSPDIVLEWTEGYAYGIAKGEYGVNGQYNSTQKFETTVFPEITKPELLTETAGSLVAFWNNDTYVGYWTAGKYHNGGMAVIEKPAFTHAAFSIRTATDYTQIELVYAEVTETVTKISKIQDVRDRTTTLEHKTDILEKKVQNLENGGASDGTGDSGEGDTGRQGKKYYLFGDSITYWDSLASWYDDTVYMVAYPSYIRDVLLADIVNCGVAGNTSANITARLKNTDLTDAYAVTYMSGANDLNQNIPIGTIGEFDTATYIGNIEAAIKYVAETYPHVKLYLLSPLYTSLGDIKPYAEAMESVADHYSVPILRWDQVSQINQFNCNYYLVDGVHPNNLGHAVMADSLIPFLKNH